MTPVATAPAHRHELAPHRSEPDGAGARVLRLAHGRLTLDELVSGAWAALSAGAPAACPVCDAPMLRVADHGPAVCRGCSSELA